MAAMSDRLENMIIDWFFRGQAPGNATNGVTGASATTGSGPPNLYVGLLTAAPSDTGGGTEVSTSGTNYARQAVVSSLANWAGTQGATTTTASTGNTGTTSNNAPIAYGAPSGNWGLVTHFGIYDALSGGNLLFWGQLTASKQVNSGDAAPSFAISALSVQIDN
jgi:hypothetical protein